MEVLGPEDIEFENVCVACIGRGKRYPNGSKDCPVCEGLGYNPTSYGDKLLEFLTRQGFTKQSNKKEENT